MNNNTLIIEHGEYVFTTCKSQMVVADIHFWLSTVSYWSAGVSIEDVQNAFDNSFCIGVLYQGR